MSRGSNNTSRIMLRPEPNKAGFLFCCFWVRFVYHFISVQRYQTSIIEQEHKTMLPPRCFPSSFYEEEPSWSSRWLTSMKRLRSVFHRSRSESDPRMCPTQKSRMILSGGLALSRLVVRHSSSRKRLLDDRPGYPYSTKRLPFSSNQPNRLLLVQ